MAGSKTRFVRRANNAAIASNRPNCLIDANLLIAMQDRQAAATSELTEEAR